MTILKIKKLYEDVILPEQQQGVLDLRIHSFHKFSKLNNNDKKYIPTNTQTFWLTQERLLVKTGLSITIGSPDYLLQIIGRKITTLHDGLVVLGHQFYSGNGELEILLYNSSDDVILLKKDYRIAQGILVPKINFNICYD